MVGKKVDYIKERSNIKIKEITPSSTSVEDKDDDEDEESSSSESDDSGSGSEYESESSDSDQSESGSTDSSSSSYSSSESGRTFAVNAVRSDLHDDPETKRRIARRAQRKLGAADPGKTGGRNRRRRTGAGKKAESQKPKRRRRRSRRVTICLTNCRYEVVRSVSRRFNLDEVGEDEPWNIYWTDFSVSLERAMDMKRYQLVNHFPGMNEICRKDLLSRNLNRMKRMFPTEYDIFPRTWSLPADLGELQQYAHNRRNKTYICKPEMGCQGRGIFLIRNIKELNPFGKIICQLYIARPFLIDNLKFDLRIYVLITTCDPLRIYVFNEGLARFATAKYKPPTNSNSENSYMHLTNYAVNKYSRDYIVDDEGGSKRKLSAVYRWLEERGYNTQELIENTDDAIIKTIVSAHPILKHNYRTCFPHHDLCSACFEILGFDVLIDYKLKPYVLEVNHSPSFHTDAQLDRDIKESLLRDTFAMLNLKQLDIRKVESDDRKRVQDRLTNRTDRKEKKETDPSALSPQEQQLQWELEHTGSYRLVYPSATSEKYDKYFEQNLSSLYQETAASQARAICTKNQIEEYNKLKQMEERKRVGQAAAQAKAQTDKISVGDKVRPESPADPEKRKKKVIKKNKEDSNFNPSPIQADEELERMKLLMQRGMLIRSLGIEVQVFKLLSQIGSLKPEEERIFRRMHFPENNPAIMSANAYNAAQVNGSRLGQGATTAAAISNPVSSSAAMEKGDPVTRNQTNKPVQHNNNNINAATKNITGYASPLSQGKIENSITTNRGDSNNSSMTSNPTISNPASKPVPPKRKSYFAAPSLPISNGDQRDSKDKLNSPYNVPYNTPAQFNPNNEALRHRNPNFGVQQQQGPLLRAGGNGTTTERSTTAKESAANSSSSMTTAAQQYYYRSLHAKALTRTYTTSDNPQQGYLSNISLHKWPNTNPPPPPTGYIKSPRTVAAADTDKGGAQSWTQQQSAFFEPMSPRAGAPKYPGKLQKPGHWTSRTPRNDGNNIQKDGQSGNGFPVLSTLSRPMGYSINVDPVQCTQMFFNENGNQRQNQGSRNTNNNNNSNRYETRSMSGSNGAGFHSGANVRGAGNMALLRAARTDAGRKLHMTANKSSPGLVYVPIPKVGDKNNLVITGVSIGKD